MRSIQTMEYYLTIKRNELLIHATPLVFGGGGDILFATASAGHLVYQLAVHVPSPLRYTKKLWEEKFFVLVAQGKGRESAGWIEITGCIRQGFLELKEKPESPALLHHDLTFALLQQLWVSSYIPASSPLFPHLLPAKGACLSGSWFSGASSATLSCWIGVRDAHLVFSHSELQARVIGLLPLGLPLTFGELLRVPEICMEICSLLISLLGLVLNLVAILNRFWVEAVVFSSISIIFSFLFLIFVVVSRYQWVERWEKHLLYFCFSSVLPPPPPSWSLGDWLSILYKV